MMGAITGKCFEDQYRPECAHAMPSTGGYLCTSTTQCHRLTEKAIEERLSYIRRMTCAAKRDVRVSMATIVFLLQVIDGLKKRNEALEKRAAPFTGFDVNGETNYAGLRQDLLEAMDNNESMVGCNRELYALLGKWRV